MRGRLIKNLVDKEKEPGYHRVNFDAKKLASGIYFAKLVVKDYEATKKLILIQ